jgi:hypothetical protein
MKKYFAPYLGISGKSFKYLEINFGKYKGEKASDIVFRKLEYIDWCFDNLKNFKIPPSLMIDFKLGIKNRLIYAIQENNFKNIEYCKYLCNKYKINYQEMYQKSLEDISKLKEMNKYNVLGNQSDL